MTERSHEDWYPTVPPDPREWVGAAWKGQEPRPIALVTLMNFSKGLQVLGFCPQPQDEDSPRARFLA